MEATITVPVEHYDCCHDEIHDLICNGPGYQNLVLSIPNEESLVGQKTMIFKGDDGLVNKVVKLVEDLRKTWH